MSLRIDFDVLRAVNTVVYGWLAKDADHKPWVEMLEIRASVSSSTALRALVRTGGSSLAHVADSKLSCELVEALAVTTQYTFPSQEDYHFYSNSEIVLIEDDHRFPGLNEGQQYPDR